MSPELLYPKKFGFDNGRPTKGSDRYALGMVILEVLSGEVPFVGDGDYVVIGKVTNCEHPKRPEGVWFTNDMWEILECCWAPKPLDRPSLEDVLQHLEKNSASWTTISHPTPSTANSSKGKLPDRDQAPATDVSQVSSPSRVVSQSAQEHTTHGARSILENTQVWSFKRPQIPALTPHFNGKPYPDASSGGQNINPVSRSTVRRFYANEVRRRGSRQSIIFRLAPVTTSLEPL